MATTPKLKLQKQQYYIRHREQIKQKQRNYYASNKERIKPRHVWHSVKNKYGLSQDQYNELLIEQNGRCAICKRLPTIKRLSVDHDHITHKIRGLLCDSCNRGIGLLQDSRLICFTASEYLARYE